MSKINVAIIGVGNCASSLVQGVKYYQNSNNSDMVPGVMHVILGGYHIRDIHVGPSDYVPWQKDNKLCFIRIESRHFGDVPTFLDCRLSVEDSPNSAGVVIDAIRCRKLALDHGLSGTLSSPSAYFMKSPPKQYTDSEAHILTEKFIKKYRKKNKTK